MPGRKLPAPEGPQVLGRHEGLAYALFLPPGRPAGAVVILHGAGSVKESHFDYARAARGQGLAALAFDQRGHGDSGGTLGAQALDDVVAMAALLPPGPLALRGSSMGGWLALAAAERAQAAAVVAICPASSEGLARLAESAEPGFAVDVPAFTALVRAHEPHAVAAQLRCALLLMHAEGDERVPVAHSHSLHAAAARRPQAPTRLVTVPGGHHRSVQHDGELQAFSLHFIARALSGRPVTGAGAGAGAA